MPGNKHRTRHRDAIVDPQRFRHDAGLIAPLPEGRSVASAIGQDKEDTTRRKAIRDERQVLFGRLVRPVDVFVDHHLGTNLRSLKEQATQSVEQLATTLLRIHARDGRVARVDANEVTDVRDGRLQVLAQLEDFTLELFRHRLLVVAVLDSEAPAEGVDQRMEGDRLTEGDASPFLPGGPVAETLAELV